MTGTWRLDKARLDGAADGGEGVVKLLGIEHPPIDPFDVIREEGERIVPIGDDFGDAFDGRIEFSDGHFLLFYNTRYDQWPHAGRHHPKTRFTIAHELGHYFLDGHRTFLAGGKTHSSFAEFSSDSLVEREADSFAAGMLMPRFLLGEMVNMEAPCLSAIKEARESFDVSLTSMMVRYVQLSDFPCAMAAIRNGSIEWGFASEAFQKVGCYAVLKGQRILSNAATDFIDVDRSTSQFRQGDGWGRAYHWLHGGSTTLDVREEYIVIPSTKQVLVFLAASEDDLCGDSDMD